ncbi:hypothetical protein psyc5s11_18430 [Clostridium gelidum]|uniref:EamA domain-containing protein n=1 Tax=Clostridium gelidum TaxID=704125 RepID=A0ABM7T1L0_9CLOT|nr:hypothetical protein [Clostridium gelidum]BCZ45776.1 hypothetical protein psyc5s11_18430 [Clostridium gelidum]
MVSLNRKSILEFLVGALLAMAGGSCFSILREYQTTYKFLFIIRYIIIFVSFSSIPIVNKKFSDTKYYKFIIIFLIILNIILTVIE